MFLHPLLGIDLVLLLFPIRTQERGFARWPSIHLEILNLFRYAKANLMRLVLLLSIAALLIGCEPKGPYPLTIEKILEQQKALPGEIFLVQGEKQGVFKVGPSTVGNVNTAGNFRVVNIDKNQGAAQWPATPGYYYETQSYLNLATGTLYVVR